MPKEFTGDPEQMTWLGNPGGVEVAFHEDVILVRHTMDVEDSKAILVFDKDEWRAFIGSAKDGEFDLV
jgi:hypothetical protein